MTTRAATRKAPSHLRISAGAQIDVRAEAGPAEADPSKPKARTFTSVAYTGARMQFWYGALVMDMAGMDLPKGKFPALLNHRTDQIVGTAESVEKTDKGLEVAGRLSAASPHGVHAAAMSDEGFPWQASCGWAVAEYEEVEEGDEAEVNGRTEAGPCLIARKSTLKEVSFVPLGADGNTSAVAAALDGAPEIEPKRRKPMSEPTKTGATLAELKAAFPKDREFALDQFEAGATIAEAKAAFADVLATKLEAADKALNEAKAAKPAPAPAAKPSVRGGVAVGASAPIGAPSLNIAAMIAAEIPEGAGPCAVAYHEALSAFKAKGLSDGAARAEVSKRYPAVQAAYLNEVNGTAGDDKREWAIFPMKTAMGEIRR